MHVVPRMRHSSDVAVIQTRYSSDVAVVSGMRRYEPKYNNMSIVVENRVSFHSANAKEKKDRNATTLLALLQEENTRGD